MFNGNVSKLIDRKKARKKVTNMQKIYTQTPYTHATNNRIMQKRYMYVYTAPYPSIKMPRKNRISRQEAENWH